MVKMESLFCNTGTCLSLNCMCSNTPVSELSVSYFMLAYKFWLAILLTCISYGWITAMVWKVKLRKHKRKEKEKQKYKIHRECYIQFQLYWNVIWMWQTSDNFTSSYSLVNHFQIQILNVSDNVFLILQKEILPSVIVLKNKSQKGSWAKKYSPPFYCCLH